MKIFYGVSKDDIKIMKERLKSDDLPLIGYIPNRNPKSNGKFVIKYPNGRRKYIIENKKESPILLFGGIADHTHILYKLRMQALDGEL